MAEELKKEESPETEKYAVKAVCAWCGKEMGDAGFTKGKKGETSHGICPDCKESLLKKWEEENKEKKE